jgi:hypothetical protein
MMMCMHFLLGLAVVGLTGLAVAIAMARWLPS